MPLTPEERFWSHVDIRSPHDCWEWQLSRYASGYGQASYRGKQMRAHRVALILDGRPPGNKHALHHCDNPPCCNPNHLYVGTSRENQRDINEWEYRIALANGDIPARLLEPQEDVGPGSRLHCLRCAHEWHQVGDKHPKVCPRCTSYQWQVPGVRWRQNKFLRGS